MTEQPVPDDLPVQRLRPSTPCWYVRGATWPSSGLTAVTCWRSDAHPDGSTVPAGLARTADAEELWSLDVDEDARPRLRVAADPQLAGGLWFVALVEEGDDVDLIAFDTPDLPAGTIVSEAAFRSSAVANEAQVGAIRWSRTTATIDQIYVLPQRRRRRIGTVLVYAASALHQASGWPGALQADGRRTRLGEQLVGSLPGARRVAPWSIESPPMDAS